MPLNRLRFHQGLQPGRFDPWYAMQARQRDARPIGKCPGIHCEIYGTPKKHQQKQVEMSDDSMTHDNLMTFWICLDKENSKISVSPSRQAKCAFFKHKLGVFVRFRWAESEECSYFWERTLHFDTFWLCDLGVPGCPYSLNSPNFENLFISEGSWRPKAKPWDAPLRNESDIRANSFFGIPPIIQKISY